MDSMRSLNTSLPKARKPAPGPDVHQSFRSAALTVTNLYKSALAECDKARSEGYQEALGDLITFLDKENLGVGDGEGWRIRQWAMERVEGGVLGHSNSDSDEDAAEEKRARSSSPVLDRNSSPEDVRLDVPNGESTQRCDSAPPVQAEPATDADMPPPSTIFHFNSPHSYPATGPGDASAPDFTAAARRAFPSQRRISTRSSSRSLQRSAASSLLSLGSGAGQKRKHPLDFFDLDSFHDRRDGFGGGPKRGRTS